MTRPLRLALVLEDPLRPPDWCARLIAQVHAEPRLELVALVQSAGAPAGPAAGLLARSWFALERMLTAGLRPADRAALAAAVADIPVVSVGRLTDIAALTPDVILDLSAGEGRTIDPGLARHGVWFGDFLHPAAGLAALAAGAPLSRIALFRRTAGKAEPIGVAAAALNPKFIATRNALFMREKAVPLILRALRRTQALGAPDEPQGLVPAPWADPGAGEMARYLLRLARNLAARGFDSVRSMMRRRPGMFFLKSSQSSLRNFDPATARAHVSETDSYFADPFLWDHEGEVYCFFEEFVYAARRGHISAGLLTGGDLIGVRPALRTGYHLSFPFLFEHEGALYMLPETSEVRRLEVWRCAEFPHRWERHATALEGVAASDSTLNLIGGSWWLFTNISHDAFDDMNSELHIFRVDGPGLKTIEPHRFNPVVIDSNRARNAGRIFELDGKLYRPCQENSHGHYGHGLRLMEVRHLSLDDYEETEARAFAPDFEPGIDGCHHLDVRSGRVVMDVRKRVGGHA